MKNPKLIFSSSNNEKIFMVFVCNENSSEHKMKKICFLNFHFSKIEIESHMGVARRVRASPL